jgi:hypothetical protein
MFQRKTSQPEHLLDFASFPADRTIAIVQRQMKYIFLDFGLASGVCQKAELSRRERPALRFIAVEKRGRRTLHRSCEFPAEIGRILNADIESLSTSLRRRMGRIASQEHGTVTVRIVEKAAAPSPASRAKSVQPRTLEIFHALLFCERVEKRLFK